MADSEPASSPTPTATSRARKLANAFIALFLAIQVAVPLSYYLGNRMYDERFGWRMFSTLRLQACELEVEEVPRAGSAGAPRPVRLHESLHIAWINLMKRGRPDVIDKAMRARCTGDDVFEVRVARRCRDTDGSMLPREKRVLDCASGRVAESEEAP